MEQSLAHSTDVAVMMGSCPILVGGGGVSTIDRYDMGGVICAKEVHYVCVFVVGANRGVEVW